MENTQEPTPQEVSEVSAEFLAALPPSIQEEVLAQQRLEQQRQQAALANPDDPTSFLLSLPQSLRQTVSSSASFKWLCGVEMCGSGSEWLV